MKWKNYIFDVDGIEVPIRATSLRHAKYTLVRRASRDSRIKDGATVTVKMYECLVCGDMCKAPLPCPKGYIRALRSSDQKGHND